ncbi:histidine kinase [Blautia schinkii]|uniref:sensor histidine kinase n=1 Tax=Blautia schinkii TaxID=180164 RepID=UPI00157106F5|nr:histidine kinase [Blautia schinkii]NSG83019.1 histidine kinase [Blautia schinkii]NSK23624.1 histidine kinase [Blautia schinkii]NSK26662.1 histidine kinase [Blautia schinkii]NSK32673.1 histidine kinase [Blautia schinkii]NSK50157.1 histidine kinase [Blautia schinkii]
MRALWRRFKNGYLNLSLQTKFTIALISIVVVPAFLTVFLFYGRLYSMVVSNTIRQEQDASAKTAPLIERTMETILATTRNITGQNFFQELFYMPVSDSAEELATSNHAIDFKNALQRLTTDSIVTDVRIYVDFPDDLKELDTYPNTENILAPLSQAKGTYWYGIFQGNRNAQEMFCPSFYLGSREKKNYGDMAYICPLSLYYHSTAYKAYLAVYYSDDKLTSILSDNLSLEGSVSYIVNERDAIVATSDPSLSGIYQLDYDTIKASFMSSNNFIERNILDTKVYAGFYSISNTDWFMVTVLPSPPLIHASNRLMIQIALIYAVFLVLALIFANVLAHSITGRLSSVIRQMQTVRHGPPTPMDSPSAHDEIGDLIDTYNYMTRKMDELMKTQAKAAEDLRIAEFNSLQAQINPHFLYNTMDMINWMALQGQTDEISHAVQSLSRFYKLTLSRQKGISTIARELEHVTIYVQLQNMRYHDSIELITDIPDELSEYQIPKLTLQPVVENSILHGILEKESKSGTIVITGWMENEDVVLLVSDDGVGIPPEILSTILSGNGNSQSGGTNIAVYNTHRRLQILYGNDYGLTYSSKPGEGTEVEIRFPAHREK